MGLGEVLGGEGNSSKESNLIVSAITNLGGADRTMCVQQQ